MYKKCNIPNAVKGVFLLATMESFPPTGIFPPYRIGIRVMVISGTSAKPTIFPPYRTFPPTSAPLRIVLYRGMHF